LALLRLAVIDNEKKLRDVLPIRPMIREGLIGLSDFEIPTNSSRPRRLDLDSSE